MEELFETTTEPETVPQETEVVEEVIVEEPVEMGTLIDGYLFRMDQDLTIDIVSEDALDEDYLVSIEEFEETKRYSHTGIVFKGYFEDAYGDCLDKERLMQFFFKKNYRFEGCTFLTPLDKTE